MSQIVIPKTMVIEKGGVTFIFKDMSNTKSLGCPDCVLSGYRNCDDLCANYCEYTDSLYEYSPCYYICTEIRNGRY